MDHPGRNTPYSIRKLAEAIGLTHHSTVGHLLSGERLDCDEDVAKRIAETLGVPLLVLFAEPPSLDQNETNRETQRQRRRDQPTT